MSKLFDPGLLWPGYFGGGIPLREFVPDGLISPMVLCGDFCPYLVGCGSCETNCDSIVSRDRGRVGKEIDLQSRCPPFSLWPRGDAAATSIYWRESKCELIPRDQTFPLRATVNN